MSDEKYSDCVNAFTFNLFQKLFEKSQKNEFFSSFSILTALNMALLGAKNNTEKELFNGLGYNIGFENSQEVHTFFQKILESKTNSENKSPFWKYFIRKPKAPCQPKETLNIANRFLVHKAPGYSVNTDYIKQLLAIYMAQVDEINFVTENNSAVKKCNGWVNKVTKGKIPTIVDELDIKTRAVILNAIYFKGDWETPFEVEFTKMEPFFNFGEKEKAQDVPLMFMSDVSAALYLAEVDDEELQMLKLPYKGTMTMNILMTKSLNGLKMIEAKINYDLIKNMNYFCEKIEKLWLPKFKMDTSYDLCELLEQLGINEAFSDSADFTGIRKEKDIKITKVIHKASIEVNEEGTVAAAATGIEFGYVSVKPKMDFRVDHPFMYFIQDWSNGLILFTGIVNEFKS